jgi:hypothetical protein
VSFTKRLRHHLKSSLEVFSEVVSYESLNGKEFKTEAHVKRYMRVQARSILTNNKLIPTSSGNEFLYKHFKTNLGYARINTETKTCTCSKYFDKGVCKHLVAACLKQQVHLPGLVQLPKKFKIIRRNKRRQYLNDSREEVVDDILNDVECDKHPEVDNPTLQQSPIETHDPKDQPPKQKKRGRKPKAKPTINENDEEPPMGRPPMAIGALEFEGTNYKK